MIKNRLLPLVVLLFSVSCVNCEQEPLVEVLGQPCLLNDTKKEGYDILSEYDAWDMEIGICHAGHIIRDENDKKICVGEQRSKQETCNNLDDDCDGTVDNSWSVNREYWDSRNECLGLGVCRYAEQICIDGQYICIYPDSYGKEICDARDNDCDGDTDEDTEDDPIFDPADRYVYTADPDTINIGECRAGYKECVDGQINIRNMRTPVTEICGNGDDDDCDGTTDEDETTNQTADYLLVIDYSGSMIDIINSVAAALCEWSVQGVLSDSRFAVIAIGYSHNTSVTQIKKLTDFTDSRTACNIIRLNNQSVYSGGLEYQLDAVYNSNNQSSSFYVDWQSTNKKVIIFSDEEMQEYIFTSIQDGVTVISQQCLERGYSVSAFVDYNVPNQSQWVELTQNCGGFLDYLSPNPQNMIDSLNYWIGTDC